MLSPTANAATVQDSSTTHRDSALSSSPERQLSVDMSSHQANDSFQSGDQVDANTEQPLVYGAEDLDDEDTDDEDTDDVIGEENGAVDFEEEEDEENYQDVLSDEGSDEEAGIGHTTSRHVGKEHGLELEGEGLCGDAEDEEGNPSSEPASHTQLPPNLFRTHYTTGAPTTARQSSEDLGDSLFIPEDDQQNERRRRLHEMESKKRPHYAASGSDSEDRLAKKVRRQSALSPAPRGYNSTNRSAKKSRRQPAPSPVPRSQQSRHRRQETHIPDKDNRRRQQAQPNSRQPGTHALHPHRDTSKLAPRFQNKFSKEAAKNIKMRNGQPSGLANGANILIFELRWDLGMDFKEIARHFNSLNVEREHESAKNTDWVSQDINNRYGRYYKGYLKQRGIFPIVGHKECKAEKTMLPWNSATKEVLKFVVVEYLNDQQLTDLHELKHLREWRNVAWVEILDFFEQNLKWQNILTAFEDKMYTLHYDLQPGLTVLQLKVMHARILNDAWLANPILNGNEHSAYGSELDPRGRIDEDEDEEGEDSDRHGSPRDSIESDQGEDDDERDEEGEDSDSHGSPRDSMESDQAEDDNEEGEDSDRHGSPRDSMESDQGENDNDSRDSDGSPRDPESSGFESEERDEYGRRYPY